MSRRIINISNVYALAHTTTVRAQTSSTEQIRAALCRIGHEFGKAIIEEFYTTMTTITTPMSCNMSSPIITEFSSVVITTKDDMPYFGFGIKSVLGDCRSGHIDFAGVRGDQVFNSPAREIYLPDASGCVDAVIIGKSVLATGCTAMTLADRAMEMYRAEKLIIATVFYSETGLSDFTKRFPNAYVFTIGVADQINSDGMLVPGVGDLDTRTSHAA